MKRIILSVFMLTALSAISNKTNAQTKIGYFDENTVLGLMPGIQKVDTLLNQFNQDSLQGEYEYTLGEFKRKDDLSASWVKLGRTAFSVHAISALGLIFLIYYLIHGHFFEYYYVTLSTTCCAQKPVNHP